MNPTQFRFTTLNSLLAVVLVLGALGCSQGDSETAKEAAAAPAKDSAARLTIAAGNYPVAYMAERIAGDLADVEFFAPSDEDPAYWTPSQDDISKFQAADLILLNGASYEKWESFVTLPEAKTVRTAEAFKPEWLELKLSIQHSHGPGGEHSHTGVDFNTWLDPELAALQAGVIRDELIKALPAKEAAIKDGFNKLQSDLQGLDKQIAEIVTDDDLSDGKPLLASHPVYGYLADRYTLNLRSMLWEPDVTPDEEAWSKFDELIETHPAKWMLWEGEPTEETLAKLKERGVECIVFDQCGNRPDEGDYLSVMNSNIDRFAKIYRSDEK